MSARSMLKLLYEACPESPGRSTLGSLPHFPQVRPVLGRMTNLTRRGDRTGDVTRLCIDRIRPARRAGDKSEEDPLFAGEITAVDVGCDGTEYPVRG